MEAEGRRARRGGEKDGGRAKKERDNAGQTSINQELSMGDGIYREQPNAMAINQGLECQLYQYPLQHGYVDTHTERITYTHLKIGLYVSQFSAVEHYVDGLLWLVSTLNIISMSRTRTHTEKQNEYFTYTITEQGLGDGTHFTLQGVANCF